MEAVCEQRRIMKLRNPDRVHYECVLQLTEPDYIPLGLRTKLAMLGLETTEQVHEHIKNGSLSAIRGIGSVTEAEILAKFTNPVKLWKVE